MCMTIYFFKLYSLIKDLKNKSFVKSYNLIKEMENNTCRFHTVLPNIEVLI